MVTTTLIEEERFLLLDGIGIDNTLHKEQFSLIFSIIISKVFIFVINYQINTVSNI